MRTVKRIAIVALLAVWVVVLRPAYLGGPAGYVQVSGHSMDPTLHSGDIVLTARRSSYDVGTVVAYRVPAGQPGEGHVVIHRIVGGSARAGYRMRGDNRDSEDLWRPRPADVVGAQRLRVPAAALVARWLLTPLGLGLLAALATIIAMWPAADARTPRRSPDAPASTGASRTGTAPSAAGQDR